ncbi:uncharacterized protein EHS24_003879 [Apiotrichum porosum]|uniref:AA1-like domain-containing protein n=1 Tax=Apiotrichum porosum TaxID=105984 RepID=A0A427XDN9_9TREE|nr:uncharacterized protein EHS24_003879 [Apiotrichum porosum]RSH76942.1 hypothetical protein EHS24_003879 [Apiotrichum porosum]
MVKTSTATGWSALFLAAQVALSPVAGSPLNVIETPLLERTHSAGQKRDHSLTMTFYSEANCDGTPFLLSDTGSSADAGETGCFAPYDPSNGNQKCAKAVKVSIHSTWSGTGYVLSLYQYPQCNGEVHSFYHDNVSPETWPVCYPLPDSSCFDSTRIAFF